MVTIDEVASCAESLPDVTRGKWSADSWAVGGKVFAWVRGYSKADLRRFGDESPPQEPILAVRVEDLGEKQAVLESGLKGFFTIPHFDGYAAVLIELRKAGKRAVKEAVVDAWLACAKPAVAASYLEQHPPRRR